MARLVYRGRAQAAVGMLSPADKFWFNASLHPRPYDPQAALKAALRKTASSCATTSFLTTTVTSSSSRSITGAGNKTREHLATMMQEDLSKIGIKLNIVALDFPSLIERITRTFDYEACLLGLTNMTFGTRCTNECLAEFRRQSPVEPQSEAAGNRAGKRRLTA